jgi:hypothetical protein
MSCRAQVFKPTKKNYNFTGTKNNRKQKYLEDFNLHQAWSTQHSSTGINKHKHNHCTKTIEIFVDHFSMLYVLPGGSRSAYGNDAARLATCLSDRTAQAKRPSRSVATPYCLARTHHWLPINYNIHDKTWSRHVQRQVHLTTLYQPNVDENNTWTKRR